MISNDASEFLWVQKYRPKKVEECILPEELKTTFKSMAAGERIPSLLLAGPPGTGKTTVAMALCEEVGAEWLLINGSEENGIDVLRNKVRNFVSTISMYGAKKVVVIDESDYLNPNSVQPALRGFAEEFSKNATFILTCNYKNRLIEPLKSRFTPIDFKIPAEERPKLASQFMKRIEEILKIENVEYDKKVIAALINRHFPDFRRVLNELQRYSVSGKIDEGILQKFSDESFNELIRALQDKKFNAVRAWAANNLDVDSVQLFSDLYEKASVKLEPKSIPELVLLLAKYQYQSAFVANQEINNVACLTEIMMNVHWK